MEIVASAPLAVNVNRQRPPLARVDAIGHFIGGADDEDLLYGYAILEIEAGGELVSYWTQANTDRGNVVGWQLKKFNAAEVYHLPASLDSCSCADATFRPERPGGCKHAVALRMALASRWPVTEGR